MGNSGPSVTKESGRGSAADLGLQWGFSGMQGWRKIMEDAHFSIPNLKQPGWEGMACFGVLDGHGGKDVALFCARELPIMISVQPSQDRHVALVDAFNKLDDMMLHAENLDCVNQGCTAVVCCVSQDALIVANCGDSRIVLSQGGRAVPLSEDHKPFLDGERNRIEKAGGRVVEFPVGGPRVNGDLNLSRCLGDHRYKKDSSRNAAEQIITSTPDVVTFYRQPNDEFMILACDGVWDVLSNDDAVGLVRHRLLAAGPPSPEILSSIAEEMLDSCISPDLQLTGGIGGDNMTAMIITFDNANVTWGMKHFKQMLGCGFAQPSKYGC